MLVKGVSQAHLLAWANMHNKNDVYDTVHSFEKPSFKWQRFTCNGI